MNFWQTLPTPFFTVAPMADVTDAAFRRMIAKYSKTDVQTTRTARLWRRATRYLVGGAATAAPSSSFVTWTEFVSADGLALAPEEGRKKLMADLIYSEAERPIVAQLFSSNPAHMEAAAALCRELGFDGVDINMGCPDRSIEKQGCGAAMIQTPSVAVEIIRAAKRGARHGEADGIPVSVKTRLGYNEDEVETWLPVILKESPAALTVHCRTRKEMSKVPARWERLQRVVALRDVLSPETRIIGNGDVLSLADGRRKAKLSGACGVMVGRALFGDPWFFHPNRRLPITLTSLPTHGVNRETIIAEDTGDAGVEYIGLEERLRVLVEHSRLFVDLLPHKSFNVMKKHYKAYCNGFPHAKELRTALMDAADVDEVESLVDAFLEQNNVPYTHSDH